MSRTANDEQSSEDSQWSQARDQLFQMIMEGRSFSGRERNCCFLNTADGQFATISAIAGFDYPDDGRCVAVSDWDGDGDEDLWIANRTAPRLRMMRNDAPSVNEFLRLRLVGDGLQTNRDAIGARVEVILRERSEATEQAAPRLVKTLHAGEGFLSQSSKWLHFGLGTGNTVEQIIVHWPAGDRETFANVSANGRYRIRQGSGQAELLDAKPRDVALRPEVQVLPPATRKSRVLMQTLSPMPSIEYTTADGSVVTERFESGTPTLINLWASWCSPCLKEMAEFTAQASRLKSSKIRILSLSVDQLGEDPTPPEDVTKRIAKLGFPHDWGHLDAIQMEHLQQMHNRLFFLRDPLPLPTSFLVDAQGDLSVIYRGDVSVDQLIADAGRSAEGYEQLLEQSACLPGRAIAADRTREVANRFETQSRYLEAVWLEEIGLFQDAIESFGLLIDAAPDWAVPHRHLARLHLKQEDFQLAQQHATQSLAIESDDAGAHNTLGLVLSELKDSRRAEHHLREAVKLAPSFAEAHNNLGTILAMKGDLSAAGQSFQRAVNLDETFAEAQTNLGKVYASRGDVNQAIRHYRRAIELDPEQADAYNSLGTMLVRKGNLKQAIQCYQQAIKLEPQNRGAQRNLQRAVQLWQTGQQP